MDDEAFLYMWINIVSGKRYVGAHKGPLDDGYISSCKTLNEDYNTAPYLFTRIILEHGPFERMLERETSILNLANAKDNPDFYNQHNGDGKFYNKRHTEATKKKMSLASKGKPKSEEHRRKLSERAKGNSYHLGHKHSESTRAKMSRNWNRSPERLEKMRESHLGKKIPDRKKPKPFSLEHRTKISAAVTRSWYQRKGGKP
jgi:hypothetical protein